VLKQGATVPDLVGLAGDGSPAVLHYDDVSVPTVLYVFTPQCGWCKKNVTNLQALIDQSAGRYRIAGVSLTRQDLDSYIKSQNLHLPVYSDVRADIRAVYGLGGTPETIVVSPQSKVLGVWMGAYEPNTRVEIEKFLRIRLPGCCA
jgi:peroxiredoxin